MNTDLAQEMLENLRGDSPLTLPKKQEHVTQLHDNQKMLMALKSGEEVQLYFASIISKLNSTRAIGNIAREIIRMIEPDNGTVNNIDIDRLFKAKGCRVVKIADYPDHMFVRMDLNDITTTFEMPYQFITHVSIEVYKCLAGIS